MSDKELIKQEVERLKHNTPNAYDLSRFMLLEEIESFIDSLPEESGCEVNFTTKSEDLEEEIQRFVKSSSKMVIGVGETARHFAEWQKQKSKQDFLEKAERFIEDTQIENFICRDDGIYFDNERFIEQFKNYMQDE